MGSGGAEDLSDHTLEACEHLVVGETYHTNALLGQVGRAPLIVVVAIVVGTAVEFHTQTGLWTVEVEHERAYALLSAELQPADTTTLQRTPEQSLGGCQVVAQVYALFFLFRGIRLG